MSRILVTGAAGFIGSHLTDRLLARGDEVCGLDNFDAFYDPAIKWDNLVAARKNERFVLIEGDLRNRDQVQQTVQQFRPDRVVHLAAMAGVRPSIERPQVYQEVNIGGTLNLLDAMKECDVSRLIFGSTSSVYGDTCTPPFRESEAADRPCSPYAATKRAAEVLTYTYHHLHGLQVTCLRFFTVYGPRQRPEMAVHRFARLMARGRPVPMFGDGSSSRDYTYIDDILDGVIRAIDHEEDYGIYNLGESKVTRLKDLIGMLEEALGMRAEIQQLDTQPGDVPATCADITKAREVLGYDPQVLTKEGIRRFVTWFREQRP